MDSDTKYNMSFTTGGLLEKESLTFAIAYLKTKCWKDASENIKKENLFQYRTLVATNKVLQELEDFWWDKATKSEKTAFCIGFMMGEVELSAPVSGADERFYNISAPKYYRKFGSEPNWNMVTKGYKMGLTTNAPPEVVNTLKIINQICNVILQELNNPYAS